MAPNGLRKAELTVSLGGAASSPLELESAAAGAALLQSCCASLSGAHGCGSCASAVHCVSVVPVTNGFVLSTVPTAGLTPYYYIDD